MRLAIHRNSPRFFYIYKTIYKTISILTFSKENINTCIILLVCYNNFRRYFAN